MAKQNLIKKIVKKLVGKQRYLELRRWKMDLSLKKESKLVLLENDCFQNQYKGKRCFILGNGPSLKDVDLSLLQDEYVFTSNRAFLIPDFDKLHTNFHLIMDERLLGTIPDHYEGINIFDEIKQYENYREIDYFFPLRTRNVLKEQEPDIKKYYLWQNWHCENGIPEHIICSRSMPFTYSVVQTAIILAVNMGFKEIYLLGIDSTTICSTLEIKLGQSVKEIHAYRCDENDLLSELRSRIHIRGMAWMFSQEGRYHRMFGWLYDYCQRHDRVLRNCTEATLVDSIPRENLDVILQNKKTGQKTVIKLFVMDVDGTMTDGRIYYNNSGEELKAFHVRDGAAIKDILKSCGVITAIITGRTSFLLEKRAKELDITEIYQGAVNKRSVLECILKKYQIGYEATAYIGDDINDLDCMRCCKITAAPSDADGVIKRMASYICQAKGGEGAIRDFTEYLLDKGYIKRGS